MSKKLFYFMASSVSGQDESNPTLFPTLPEWERWSYLACSCRSELPAVSHKKNFLKSHTINPLLTKLIRSRWLKDISLTLFCKFMNLNSILVLRQAKKKLGQYPGILTSHLVNHPYIFFLVFSAI